MSFYIAIIDYGKGNLKSVKKLLDYLNISSLITSNPQKISSADGVILPGVGAFKKAMEELENRKLKYPIIEYIKENRPFFGICLGMQLLFSESYEMGFTNGLDIIRGKVKKFDIEKVKKIPHVGWNEVNFKERNEDMIKSIPNKSFFYFVHSYYCIPESNEVILGSTKYRNVEFCSMIKKDQLIATQFHPEKSARLGIEMMRNFIEICKK